MQAPKPQPIRASKLNCPPVSWPSRGRPSAWGGAADEGVIALRDVLGPVGHKAAGAQTPVLCGHQQAAAQLGELLQIEGSLPDRKPSPTVGVTPASSIRWARPYRGAMPMPPPAGWGAHRPASGRSRCPGPTARPAPCRGRTAPGRGCPRPPPGPGVAGRPPSSCRWKWAAGGICRAAGMFTNCPGAVTAEVSAGEHQLIGVGGQLPGVLQGKERLFHT